ncbi:MAG: hypothetical protein RR558_05155 [Coprobacillus sp.]
MKKILLFLGVSLLIVGCQSQEVKRESMEASHTYTIENDIDFRIEKTQVINRISPSNKNKDYKYIEAKDDHQFIDIILKTKNLTDKEMNIQDIYSGTFRIDRQAYDVKVAIESDNYTQMSTTDSLKSNQERYIHIYCEVPTTLTETEVTVEIDVHKDKQYKYVFQTEKPIIDNDIKSVGDTLVFKQTQVEVKNLIQTKKIEPSQKGFFYSYIPVDNQDETFVVLQLDVKNLTEQSFDPSDYMYCEYITGETVVKSNVIIESDNHESISKKGTIAAGQTRTIYLTMAINDSLLNKESKIELFVEGETITIQK